MAATPAYQKNTKKNRCKDPKFTAVTPSFQPNCPMNIELSPGDAGMTQ